VSALDWLEIRRGSAPLIVTLPHTGTEIPDPILKRLTSPWLGRRDTDWWIDQLYDFAEDLDATVIRTRVSRTVIDVNRDPSGVSLYPGQATTELCPTTSFDGDPLYHDAEAPNAAEIERRQAQWFAPFHQALHDEVERLRGLHPAIVVYDCHSIRSRIPRLFEGELPVFNLGTNFGATCAPELSGRIEAILAASGQSHVVNGRFRGGQIVRSTGNPAQAVHAVQMELACRSYIREPAEVDASNWPTPYDPEFAAPTRRTLRQVLEACRDFATSLA